MIAAGTIAPVVLPGPPAAAVPGAPGVPAAATVVYDEDFENGPAVSPILRLDQYTGASGQTYTADPAWLRGCNGWLAAAAQDVDAPAPLADCLNSREYWNNVQQLSQAIGVLHGQSAQTAAGNHAVSAYTASSLNGETLEFATTANVPLPTSSRFLAFSVDVAAINCTLTHPELQFSLVNPQGQQTATGAPIDGCSSPTTVAVPALGVSPARDVVVGTYTTNSAVLFSGASVGVRMTNVPYNFGNDHSFDNIRILDATPQLDKEFIGGWGRTGGTARLRFTITNTAELGAKQGWSFQDELPAGITVAAPSAATSDCPGGTITTSATSVSVSGGLSAGMTSCTVELDVTAPTTGSFVNSPDRVSVVGLNPPASAGVTFSDPRIALTKSAGTPIDVNQDGLVDAGDTIPYRFAVQNTGDVPLTGVVVDDPLLPGLPCPTTLAVGERAECSADYTITATDAAAGRVVNTATASGAPPAPGPVATSAPVTTTTDVTAAMPGIRLVKSVSPTAVVEGEVLTYSFVVDNAGNLPLHDVAIAEQAFTGTGPLSPVDCPTTDLAVGGELVCTATYTVTHADLVAGTVDNTATATGTPAGIGAVPITSAPSTVGLSTPAAPALTATKTASPLVVHAAGDTIAYTIAVSNDGNLVVDGLTIDETQFTGSGPAPTFACGQTRLVPGQHTTCTAAYTATQEDVDGGGIRNTATASGSTTDGTAVTSPPTSVAVTSDAVASVSLTKSASAPSVVAAGQVLRYDFAVRNTGGVTLHGLVVDDVPAAPAGALDAAPSCPATTVAPGRTVTCTATYTVSQADVDHGTLADTATATAVDPTGASVGPVSDTLSIPVVAVARLSIAKAADADSIDHAGQVVGYRFTVTNTGAVSIGGVRVSDTPVAPAGPLDGDPQCDVTALAPGAHAVCTATYRVTQTDVDHGSLADTATASGTDAHGAVVVSPPDGLRLGSTAVAGLTLGPLPAPTGATVGESVPLSFVATNTGALTLADVVLVDDRGGRAACEPAALAPGQAATCRITPTVTQQDLDAGALAVTATATGTTTSGADIRSLPVTETVPVTGQVASLSLTKSASADMVALGGMVQYRFTVRNTGTVTLTALSVVDTQSAPAGPLEADPVCATDRLAPAETTTCTAAYEPTVADLANGSVTDTAVAHARTTLGDQVSSEPATLTVPVTAPASGDAAPPGTTAGGLAETGSDLTMPLLAAMALLAGGVVVRRSARSRREE